MKNFQAKGHNEICVSGWSFHHRIEKDELEGKETEGRQTSLEITAIVSVEDGKSINKGRNNVNGGEEAESTGFTDSLEVKDDPQVSVEQTETSTVWDLLSYSCLGGINGNQGSRWESGLKIQTRKPSPSQDSWSPGHRCNHSASVCEVRWRLMTDTGTPTLGEREKKKPKGELKEEQLGSWKEMTP